MIDKSLYRQTEIPQELDTVVRSAIWQGKLAGKRRIRLRRIGAAAAALGVCMVLLLNFSPTVARAVAQVPVLGDLCRIVTFREYHQVNEIRYLDARIPQMENWGRSDLEKRVNLEIQKKISECIAENEAIAQDYYDAFLQTGGKPEDFVPLGITVDYEVKSITGTYASFVIWQYESAFHAYNQEYYYNIDLESGRNLSLKDWLGEDYEIIAADSIEKTIAGWEDSQKALLWPDVDYRDLISENTNFYINENQQAVVVFPRYTLACGAAGQLEFVIQP